jgi:MIZ/SP-RING zinc finger
MFEVKKCVSVHFVSLFDVCCLLFWQMSGLRMKVAGRFKPCAHMGCFDLEAFVSVNERARKVFLL